MKEEKGITLIALVITIIVMLILVAVTISIAVQGNLFNTAGNAVNETEKAKIHENDLGNGVVGNDAEGNPITIDEIVNSAVNDAHE